MKTKIIALVATALVTPTTFAAPKTEQNREEGIGVGGGAVAGAILGGPIGLLVGAATGGWLGGKFHKSREAREEAEARQLAAEARQAEAERLATSLEAMMAASEQEHEAQTIVMRTREDALQEALREAFEVEVYFHTGESALAAPVAARVGRLGEILRGFEGLAVVIEGHADPRGDEAYNEELSAQRAAAVREALIGAGLEPTQITTRAAGETDSAATEGDLDAMALERRVDLSIVYPLPRENRVARQ